MSAARVSTDHFRNANLWPPRNRCKLRQYERVIARSTTALQYAAGWSAGRTVLSRRGRTQNTRTGPRASNRNFGRRRCDSVFAILRKLGGLARRWWRRRWVGPARRGFLRPARRVPSHFMGNVGISKGKVSRRYLAAWYPRHDRRPGSRIHCNLDGRERLNPQAIYLAGKIYSHRFWRCSVVYVAVFDAPAHLGIEIAVRPQLRWHHRYRSVGRRLRAVSKTTRTNLSATLAGPTTGSPTGLCSPRRRRIRTTGLWPTAIAICTAGTARRFRSTITIATAVSTLPALAYVCAAIPT